MRLILVLLIPVLLIFSGCNKASNEESGNTESNTTNSDRILFWGEGCSHCEVVEKWLKENNTDNRLGLSKLEVFSNKDAQTVYLEKAKICGNNTRSISVPMMYWEGECFSGDTPIIDFLKEK